MDKSEWGEDDDDGTAQTRSEGIEKMVRESTYVELPTAPIVWVLSSIFRMWIAIASAAAVNPRLINRNIYTREVI